MGEMHDFEFVSESNGPDYLKIAVNKRGGHITGKLSTIQYIDADTKQHVIVMPGLDISSYGSTLKKAEEMLKESINEYFEYLLSLSKKKRDQEMVKNGWKQDSLSQKVYSKMFVNPNGELCLNAKDNKVERLALIA